MRKDHQIFFKEVFEFYDLLLNRCEPYAKAVQHLSLSTRKHDKPLNCRYSEYYYPQTGYKVEVEDSIFAVAVGLPSNTSIASWFTFLGFDENKPEHQDMIAESVENLKFKLKELGRKPFYYDKLVAFSSADSAIIDPTVYQRAGSDFIEEQTRLIPCFRESMSNLLGLDFDKNYFFEFDTGRITDKHEVTGRFLFRIDESKNRKILEVTTWEDFHMKEEEFQKLRQIINNYGFNNISVNDQTKEYPHNRLEVSVDKLKELAQLR